MRTLTTFLFGVVTGVLLFYTATNFHVVRANDGFHLIRKTEARLPEAYVDIRNFGVNDWSQHPLLAAALVQANRQDLIGDAAANSLSEGVDQMLGGWSQ